MLGNELKQAMIDINKITKEIEGTEETSHSKWNEDLHFSNSLEEGIL